MYIYEIENEMDGDIGELFEDINDAKLYAVKTVAEEAIGDLQNTNDMEGIIAYLSESIKYLAEDGHIPHYININTYYVHEKGTILTSY